MSYRVIDEPQPTGLERFIVNPIWPFFASMFAGSWLAFPWFILNALALGGQRRNTDIAIASGGFVANAVLLWLVVTLLTSLPIEEKNYAYVQLFPAGIRMLIMYVLFHRQERAFELFSYFGGTAKNGVLVVIFGTLLRTSVLGSLPGYWKLLLG